jgi:hypothetical protein
VTLVFTPDVESLDTNASSNSFPDAVEKALVAMVVLAEDRSPDAVESIPTAPHAETAAPRNKQARATVFANE